MQTDLVLYGYSASSYVFTVRMLLAEKGAEYEQIPVHVLAGEPRDAEHLERHPFGKVPVLDHGDFRLIETIAILRYLNDTLDGPSFVPDNPRDRARMDMAMGLYDSYGYSALVGVAGYHRFPEYVGHPGPEFLDQSVAQLRKVVAELMRIRGDSSFIAGEQRTLADFMLAPACFYVDLVRETPRIFDVPGFDGWWPRVRELDSYRAAVPDLE